MVKKTDTKTIQNENSTAASFGVNAHSAEPVGGTVTPPGGAKGGEGEIIRTSPTSVNPKTKVGMMNDIIKHLSKMSKADVKSVHSSVAGVPAGEQDRPTQGNSRMSQPPRVTREDVDFSADIAAVFEGSDLSDELKGKITSVFETALITKINEKLEEITESVEADSTQTLTTINEELVAKVDGYLDYVVEQWIEENKLAVEQGLRSELIEDFLHGMRNLFAEHYIDIPEDKVDVVEELSARVSDLEEKLNNAIDENIELKGSVTVHERAEAFADAVDGLTESEVAKLETLSDAVEFTDKAIFSEKIKTLRESYFPTGKTRTAAVLSEARVGLDEQEIVSEGEEPAEVTGPMANYVKSISRTLGKHR